MTKSISFTCKPPLSSIWSPACSLEVYALHQLKIMSDIKGPVVTGHLLIIPPRTFRRLVIALLSQSIHTVSVNVHSDISTSPVHLGDTTQSII
ncbi:hypothetical protein CS542_09635 [Pedobacter sp. IW39]|nr:hypothetical protein CS542_09635 [Pedobacter sp. IW39]